MTTPKISVIVPVYEAEEYIDRCVRSVLAQDCEDFELILVNDASPDHSAEKMEAWKAQDPRITTIHLAENMRQGGARNRGLDIAQGELLSSRFGRLDCSRDPFFFT